MVNTDSARFRKSELLRSGEFKKVFSHGKRFSNRFLTVYVLKGSERKTGIVVRREVRSSVKRNRLKRLLREIFRLNKNLFSRDALFVVVAGKDASEAKFAELKTSLYELMRRAGALSR